MVVAKGSDVVVPLVHLALYSLDHLHVLAHAARGSLFHLGRGTAREEGYGAQEGEGCGRLHRVGEGTCLDVWLVCERGADGIKERVRVCVCVCLGCVELWVADGPVDYRMLSGRSGVSGGRRSPVDKLV